MKVFKLVFIIPIIFVLCGCLMGGNRLEMIKYPANHQFVFNNSYGQFYLSFPFEVTSNRLNATELGYRDIKITGKSIDEVIDAVKQDASYQYLAYNDGNLIFEYTGLNHVDVYAISDNTIWKIPITIINQSTLININTAPSLPIYPKYDLALDQDKEYLKPINGEETDKEDVFNFYKTYFYGQVNQENENILTFTITRLDGNRTGTDTITLEYRNNRIYINQESE